jgi:tetratricopeptide (TPR) repeat protein
MHRKLVVVLGVVSLGIFLTLAPRVAAQSESESPLGEQEIYDLLQKDGKTGAEVAELVKLRGIGFDVSESFEANLAAIDTDPVLLQTIKTPATITLQVGVAGATVAVDGEERGATTADGAFRVEGLEGGSHVFRISSPDHVGKTIDFFLKPAEDRTEPVILTSAIISTPSPYGTNVTVAAGTGADAILAQVYRASDPAEKITLLQQALADYGNTPVGLLGNDMLMKLYLTQKNYSEAAAAGAKVLERDPRNVSAHINLGRATLGQGDMEGALTHAEHVSKLMAEGKTLPPPEGVESDIWSREEERVLKSLQAELPSLQYDLFLATYKLEPASARSAALERFVTYFPESPYRVGAYSSLALAYQAQGNSQKMMEWAEKALEAKPDEPSMLMLVSDSLSDSNQQLDRAREIAARLLDLATNRPEKIRTAGLSDEQWASQKMFYEGIAHTILGMIHLHQKAYNPAIKEFDLATPGLKSQPFYHARNLFRKAFAYAQMGGRGNLNKAVPILTQVIAMNSPFTGPAQQTLQQVQALLGN